MSTNVSFTKENLDTCLQKLAKASLIDFDKTYPGIVNTDNATNIINNLKKRKQ